MRLSILPLLLSVQAVLGQDDTNSAGDSRRVIDKNPAPVTAEGKVMRVGNKDIDFGKWKKAGPNDLRCGCPAMNSIANHGFINHDGRNLTVAAVVPVMKDVFHLSEELATIVTNLAMLTADDPASGQFSLGMLNKHNIFEHDASMSRKDFYAGGDGFTFDRKTFDRFMSYYGKDEFIDLKKAAAARYDRVQQSRRDNPTFTYTSQQRITSYGEVIKFFRTMVDNKVGKTPVKFVKILFEEERIPFNEGWRRPNTEISGFSLASDVLELALKTNEKSDGKDGTQTINRRQLPKECPFSTKE